MCSVHKLIFGKQRTMKVLIADDHALMREGIKSITKTLPSVSVIDEAINGTQTLSKLKKNDYDLLILDLSMPGINGLNILQNMKDKGIRCRTAVLSFHPEEHYAYRAFELGASGYIVKNAPYEEIKKAIHKIAGGGRYVSPELAERLAFAGTFDSLPHKRLSNREFRVMLLLARGASISDIARELFVSDKTVSTYRSRIMKKMEMKTNAELTMYAMKNYLIE